ncbi:MAG: aminoacyl-tRNA hydrolase [Alphaproteobacteria bacterium]|nr:aminoacyl-tRNA hydrolase [Alphaproteobacteria bacterium]
MLILAGLGNPGPKYAGHRHNIGFMAADEIARRHNLSPWRKRFQAEAAEGQIAGLKVLVLKPQTYMNESGKSVAEAARFYKVPLKDVFVLYDELDLKPGKVRVKWGGGNGGHNGIRSIEAHLGKDFARVRLGIGHPGDKEKVLGHVLGDFSKTDGKWLPLLLDAVADHAGDLISGEGNRFMTAVTNAVFPPAPKAPKAPKPAPKAEPHFSTEKPTSDGDGTDESPFAILRKLKD